LPVEVSAPFLSTEAAPVSYAVLYSARQVPAQRWDGDLEELLRQAAARMRVTIQELCSSSKRRKVVQARRLVLVSGSWLLRREQQEIAAAMGLSSSAASRLLRGADTVMEMAVQLAGSLRAQGQ
jgi:hypothetical protein